MWSSKMERLLVWLTETISRVLGHVIGGLILLGTSAAIAHVFGWVFPLSH
jgi:hypothetical protein